jgi:hypothetical protein
VDDAHPPAGVEVLEIGVQPADRGRPLWLGAALVALTVAVLVSAAAVTWRWREASDPTFSAAEIAYLYDSHLPAGRGSLDWDPSTTLVQDGGEDTTGPEVEPTGCSVIINPDVPPVSVDVVSVNLTPLVRADGGQVFSGTVVTYRYRNPTSARAKYRLIESVVGQCPVFTDGITRFTVDEVTPSHDRRGRSDLSFRLGGTAPAVRISLLRFGNTITWITTAATPAPASVAATSLPDRLVTSMRRIHRAR